MRQTDRNNDRLTDIKTYIDTDRLSPCIHLPLYQDESVIGVFRANNNINMLGNSSR